ncbi:hypothetical protein ACJIZ3_025660 [Penstemon smallii]|uniref:Transmembrane protein n=1 Tax=Penstemon smallii TaxID=265156 RepID=A0ABD3TV92_9LAMI
MEFSIVTTSVAVLYFVALISVSSCSSHATEIVGVDVEKHREVNITPAVLVESFLSKDIARCARVHVSGLSRVKLGRYSSAHRVTLIPSPDIQEKSYKKIKICSHSNSSLGLCKCDEDNWESIQNGIWTSTISPFENRYIDVKFVNNFSGTMSVGIQEEFHKWRLLCLFIGFVILLLAPIVSSWVPFYYSSSMAIGICLVVIIVLFQGMKLLPTGRKSALYSTICGLALGAGSFLLNRFSMFINSVLVNFGISEEMHNPVLVFVLVGIVLAGAGFGYWLVRKFVVVEDGTVDVGIAQFVKWALRIIAVTFIFQSTLDTPLATAVLVSFSGIYYSFTSMNWHGLDDFTYSGDWRPRKWSSGRTNKKRTEFLSRSGTTNSRGTLLEKPMRSPVEGFVSPSSRSTRNPKDYISTFHKTPDRKKYSEEEWKNFTEESTRQAVAELASSPEFSDWIINNADRIKLLPEDSSEESIGSADENIAAESGSGRGFLRRRW